MCYRVKQSDVVDKYSKYYKAPPIEEVKDGLPYYYANGFSHPSLVVITKKEQQRNLELMTWGLMANWKKPFEEMLKLSNNTLNAKSETIYDLVSFKGSIVNKRCILPVEGFYEYKEVNKDKLPYFIHPKSNPYFNLACIYSFYQNPESKEWIKSFSIVTGAANELMASIHNTKKRMPLIIDNENLDNWLDPTISRNEIEHLMLPCDDSSMAAYRVSRELIKIGNEPEAFAPVADDTLF